MSRKNPAQYKTWKTLNNDPDITKKKKEQSESIICLKDINHLKFALKNTRIVIVKVEADWCQPCKALQPRYEKLAEKLVPTGNFTFFTEDVDDSSSIHASKVTAVPTFFVYTDGDHKKAKKQFTGDFDQVEELLEKIHARFVEGQANAQGIEDKQPIKVVSDTQQDVNQPGVNQPDTKNWAKE